MMLILANDSECVYSNHQNMNFIIYPFKVIYLDII